MTRFARPIKIVIGLAVLSVFLGVLYLLPASPGDRYTDPNHRFSFQLPTGADVQYFHASDGSSETLVLNGSAVGLQIVIVPRPENDFAPDALTNAYQFLAGVDASPVMVAGTLGLAFSSDFNEQDVWFAHEGYLYQLTAFDDSAALVPELLAKWSFQ